MRIIDKTTIEFIDFDGNEYKRYDCGTWEQLYGCSWEALSPQHEVDLEQEYIKLKED